MLEHLKKEFNFKNFSLNYNHLSDTYDEEGVLRSFYDSFVSIFHFIFHYIIKSLKIINISFTKKWPFINRFVYILYRLFIAIYYTIWFIESILRNAEFRAKNIYITDKNGTIVFILHPWPFYMTNWSLTILLLHLWSHTLITIYFFDYKNHAILKKIFDKKNSTEIEAQQQQQALANEENIVEIIIKPLKPSIFIKFLISFSWLFYNLTAITAIVVTTSYFSYVYINDLQVEPTIISMIGNLHRHGINTVVALIDIAIISYPIRLLHFIYTIIFGFCYSAVTYAYWLTNKKENIIYVTLDYNKPILVFIFFIILIFLTIFLQFSHYLVYRFKSYVKEKIYGVR
jgi:hypothetical protein